MIDRWLDPLARFISWRSDQATVREGDVEREIADDSESIVLVRGGVAQDAQTVRISASLPGGSLSRSDGAEAGMDTVTVVGTSSFDVQFGDRFVVNGQLYEVEYVQPGQVGRVEARARTVQ